MEVTDLVKFRRYLHYASEDGVYTPGCRFFTKCYKPEKLTSLTNLIALGYDDSITSIIEEVYNAKTSAYPEALIFALAQCVRDRDNVRLRHSAYLLAETICTSVEYLFVFFKFSFEIDPKGGSGRACRRFIRNWYLNKTALKLAEMVTSKRKYRGWSHGDLITLAHVRSDEPAKAAVLKYAKSGLEGAKKEFGKKPEAEEVLSYLETVDNFRHEKKESDVARTIESYMLSIDHLNFELMRSKEVWTALLRQIPLSTLLDNFQFLSRNRMFRNVERGSRSWDNDFINSICDALQNPAKLEESGLHPSRIYIELSSYQNTARMKLELGLKHKTKGAQQPPILSDALIRSLNYVFHSSMKSLKPTGLKYVVGLGLPLLKGRNCGYCRHMSCLNAAALITLCLLRVEREVDVLAVKTTSPETINIAPESTIEDFCCAMTDAQCQSAEDSPVQLQQGEPFVCSLFSWATEHKKKVDVFIYLSSFFMPSESIVTNFQKYKQSERADEARLVICDLGKTHNTDTIDSPDVLTVSGFDDKVCHLIEAFTKRMF